jgi:protein-ribulosamine 3-kinase
LNLNNFGVMNESQQTLFLNILQNYAGRRVKIICFRPLTGGDINKAYKVETSEGLWFAKLNRAKSYPGMFDAEAKGLELLAKAGEILVPGVIGSDTLENDSMLILEFVESGREQKDFWQNFGQNLAKLHRHSSQSFGLDHDNYIGSLAQRNSKHTHWIEFFINNRLSPQIKLAHDASKMDSSAIKLFEKLYSFLPEFFPNEIPSLLHGDLWSGNYMTGTSGQAYIIDPAVYYGHRLMDIGMTKLFGGFSREFYKAYCDEYPLENNWNDAVEIANLYPLMVHVNLFGGGYLSSVMSIIKKFS